MSTLRAARLKRANAELRRLLNVIDHPDGKALPPNESQELERRMVRWSRIVERLVLRPTLIRQPRYTLDEEDGRAPARRAA